MIPKNKELFLIKEDLIKRGIYDRKYKKKKKLNKKRKWKKNIKIK